MVPHENQSILLINHINKMKNKSHRIISNLCRKVFYKIQHPFMIKILNKLKDEKIKHKTQDNKGHT